MQSLRKDPRYRQMMATKTVTPIAGAAVVSAPRAAVIKLL
jgi:hypothetical protein